MTDAPALSVRGLTKRYRAVAAVADFNIDIAAGEFVTLLGPSGSGKSTVLSMIAGFTRPDSGSIRLRGTDITGWSPERRAFGMVYQGYALFPHMSVGENVAFGLRMRGRPKADIAARVASLLGRVRLTGLEDRLPRQLSGGQQQRVALARAIAFEPNLLLLDEPLSALDRQLRADVQRELRELNRDLGLTFIFVTHDQDEALSLSDRVAVMNEGRLIQIGTPDALYERPASRFIAGFLGQSNFIEAMVEERRGAEIAVRCGPWRLIAPATSSAAAGSAVTLVLRPERIEPGRSGAGWNSVTGIVVARSYLGASIGLDVQVEGIGPVLVTVPAWSGGPGGVPMPGEPIALGWPHHAASVLTEAEPA
ncbi:MAG TPA: ABC transporter ATP-binding protein [Xanthobacteraceae bacterium]|nr:ABC transporter ATP-binding protein [Xanthobacteraceae bacterium]